MDRPPLPVASAPLRLNAVRIDSVPAIRDLLRSPLPHPAPLSSRCLEQRKTTSTSVPARCSDRARGARSVQQRVDRAPAKPPLRQGPTSRSRVAASASSLAAEGFFLLECRKRSECEDSFDYVASSSSWTRSSFERDFRQDDHFSGYHYYHCHASCLVSIVVSLPTTYLSSLLKSHDKPLTPSHPSKPLLGYVTACPALLIALLVAGAIVFMCQHGYF